MEQLLSNGEFLEFFVEGGRTRSGKPLAPKGGLLSVVVDAVTSGRFVLFCRHSSFEKSLALHMFIALSLLLS